MILYTITPHEWIFPAVQESAPQVENFYYKGVLVTAERTENQGYRIIKIDSTNPFDYLNDEFRPGTHLY